MSKYINGSFNFKQNVTKQWAQVEVSLIDLDVHFDQIMEIASRADSYYTDVWDDRDAFIRFQSHEDANAFETEYHGVS